jgi:hypothetical protein
MMAVLPSADKGPGRVKIAWEARSSGRNGGFRGRRDSESTSWPPAGTLRLPVTADLVAQTPVSGPHRLQQSAHARDRHHPFHVVGEHVLRLNSSCSRSIAFVVRTLRHPLAGRQAGESEEPITGFLQAVFTGIRSRKEGCHAERAVDGKHG